MPYFTTEELRSLPDVDDEDRFPDERLVEAHDWIAGRVETACLTAFITTTVTDEKLSGTGCNGLRLANPYVQDVSAITVDGVAFSSPEVAAVIVDDGSLYRPDGVAWPATSRKNITVTYTHGYSETPPADLKQAMLRAARNWLLTMDAWSGKDSRATTISNEDGTFQLSTAGKGRPTGIPDVDVVIMDWAARVYDWPA